MTIPTLVGTRLGTHTGEPPLILGPSLGTSTVLWDQAADLLAPHFSLLAWDLPGHGHSPATDKSFSVAELADGVIRLANDAGMGTFCYAGLSLGGQVGLELALRHPDRVLRLAIICSAAKLGDAPAWNERAATVRAQGTPVMVDGSAKRWFAEGFIAEQSERAGALLHALCDTDDESYALCCEALAASDVRDRLREITTPTVAIYGAHDVVVGATEAECIAQHVQQGVARKVAGAAHLAPVERPEAVTAVIIDFFRKDNAMSANDRTNRDTYEEGMVVRRAVLGDEHVDRANAKMDQTTANYQNLITRYAWGDIWTRPGLDRRTRSVITLTALVANSHYDELAIHLRAAQRNGLSREEIGEVLLQTAIYCGVPAANSAFEVAQRVFAEDRPETS